MKLWKFLILLITINFALSEILECSLAFGMVFTTSCRITSGSVSNDEQLQISNASSNIINLSFNEVKFEKIPKNVFILFPKVSSFFISKNNLNQMTSSDFTNAKNLKSLSFYCNALTSIQPKVFEQCIILEQLYITDNPLTEIKEEAFYGLQLLKFLTLSNLQLKNFQPIVFKHLPALQNLKMDNCSLTSVTNDFFAFNSNLTSIGLSANLIEFVEQGTFLKVPNIRSVDLSNNKIVSISTENILYASLYSNRLKNLHIGSRTWSISADDNFISNITCDENLSIQAFSVSNNSLSKLSCVGKMGSLTDLKIDDNKLGKINKNIFSNIRNVTSFTANGNPKLKLSSKMIAPMTKLTRIQIDHFVNGYKKLNTTFPKLFSVSLNTKNWNCERVKKVAMILNVQKLYLNFVNQYRDFDKFLCNLTTYQVNKIV